MEIQKSSDSEQSQQKIQYAQKPHMHINFTRHFFKVIYMTILNIILKYGHINIALLHDKFQINVIKYSQLVHSSVLLIRFVK